MHWSSSFIVTTVLLSILSTPVTESNQRELTYSTYDETNNSWTNLTISDSEYYVQSDNARYNQIKSNQFLFDWDSLFRIADYYNFFTTTKIDDLPVIELSIKNGTHSNTIKLNLNRSYINSFDSLLTHIETSMFRILGEFTSGNIWPVQTRPIELDSTKNELSFSILFQTNDAYVHGSNNTITFYLGENFTYSNFDNWINEAPITQYKDIAPINPKDSYLMNISELSRPDAMKNLPLSEIDIVGIMNSGPVIIFSSNDEIKTILSLDDKYFNNVIDRQRITPGLDSVENDSGLNLYTISLIVLALATQMRRKGFYK